MPMLGQPPVMPGNVAGSPPAQGGSPMMAPGSGAGNQAAAIAQVKAVMSPLHRALAAVPVGSKEYKGILAALRALAPIFGEAQDGNLVPAAVAQMGQAAKSGGSPLSAVAPGLQPQMTPPSGGPSPLAAAA